MQALGLAAHEALLVFIVLSGYLLGRSWQRRMGAGPFGGPFRDFLARRSWRLLPAYWVALGVTVLVMLVLGLDEPRGTHWDTGLPFSWGKALLDLTLLTNFAGEVPLSHQFWTVPYEFHLYLLAPLIALLTGRFAVAAFAGAGTVAIVVLAPGFSGAFLLYAFVTSYWLADHGRRPDRAPLSHLMGPMVALAAVQAVGVVAFGHLGEGALRFFLADTVVWALCLAWLYVRDDGVVRERRPLDVRVLRPPAADRPRRAQPTPSTSCTASCSSCAGASSCVPAGVDQTAAQVVSVMLLGLPATMLVAEVLWRTVEEPTLRRSRRYAAAAHRTTGP